MEARREAPGAVTGDAGDPLIDYSTTDAHVSPDWGRLESWNIAYESKKRTGHAQGMLSQGEEQTVNIDFKRWSFTSDALSSG